MKENEMVAVECLILYIVESGQSLNAANNRLP